MAESWTEARRRLESRSVADASLEAEVLHRHALGTDRAGFFSGLHEELAAQAAEEVGRLVGRRLSGEPLAYILGRREFYGLDLAVDKRVMVPRQETELLVELALRAVSEAGLTRPTIADVGTGSGAVAVALAVRLPAATVYATDVSADALAVAGRNCRTHSVADRVRLLQGDLLTPVPEALDVVVSNPPYVPSGQIDSLSSEVRREPRLALDGGPDGLDVVRRLLAQAPRHLKPGGRLFVEVAPGQVEAACDMGRRAMPGATVFPFPDLMGLPRSVAVALPGPGGTSVRWGDGAVA